ncbi:MAG: hypothetical protein H6Q66_3000 [Firmicutes bacterium]|nr:hypothetical protein [Bacillota bacterium]
MINKIDFKAKKLTSRARLLRIVHGNERQGGKNVKESCS